MGFLQALGGLLLYFFWHHAEEGAIPTYEEQQRRQFWQFMRIGVVTLVTAGFLAAALWSALIWYPERQLTRGEPLIRSSQFLEMPALSPDVADTLEAMRAEKEQRLHSYGWVDREQGIIHIPIKRAMEMVAEQAGNIEE